MKVSELIAQWLSENDFRHCFYLIGGGNVAIVEAIQALGKTELIACHHEQAAAQACEFYFRTCGRLPLLLVTTGAGSSNAITGVLAAFMDSIPLFVISGNEPLRLWGSSDERVLGTQGYKSANLVAPIVKFSWTLGVINDHRERLDEARRLALEGRPGPVWIDAPKDIQLCAE